MKDFDRFDNTYFDQTGRQILVGDLLQVYHFRTRRKIHYMHHVVVMEEAEPSSVMALRSYEAEKPHYRMFNVAMNPQRVYHSAKIIDEYDWETPRKKIKVKAEEKME